MVDVALGWTAKRVELALDSAYCNETVLENLPDRVVVFGAMRPDAALTALPKPVEQRRRGRPRVRGARLPSPKQVADDGTKPWETSSVFVYRRETTVRHKTFDAQWYQVTAQRLLRIVVVATEVGTIDFRTFFTTDPTLAATEIISGYGRRWAIECTFRDLKQHLGFADSQSRVQRAVERVAPFVGHLFSLLVIWCIEGGSEICYALLPNRPWYQDKQDLSFQDILRGARHVSSPWRIVDPVAKISNFPLIESLIRHRSKDRHKTTP
jgi:hypothetical protein